MQLNPKEQKSWPVAEPVKELRIVNEIIGSVVFSASIEAGILEIDLKQFLPSPGAPAAAAPARTVLAE